jgi:hypothetical protein
VHVDDHGFVGRGLIEGRLVLSCGLFARGAALVFLFGLGGGARGTVDGRAAGAGGGSRRLGGWPRGWGCARLMAR